MSDDSVTVRYWAGAAAAAGCESEEFPVHHAATVGEMVAAAGQRHAELLTVLPVCTVLCDGAMLTADSAVYPGMVVEVLPPFAGG